jgi:hypothetical protein
MPRRGFFVVMQPFADRWRADGNATNTDAEQQRHSQ